MYNELFKFQSLQKLTILKVEIRFIKGKSYQKCHLNMPKHIGFKYGKIVFPVKDILLTKK